MQDDVLISFLLLPLRVFMHTVCWFVHDLRVQNSILLLLAGSGNTCQVSHGFSKLACFGPLDCIWSLLSVTLKQVSGIAK